MRGKFPILLLAFVSFSAAITGNFRTSFGHLGTTELPDIPEKTVLRWEVVMKVGFWQKETVTPVPPETTVTGGPRRPSILRTKHTSATSPLYFIEIFWAFSFVFLPFYICCVWHQEAVPESSRFGGNPVKKSIILFSFLGWTKPGFSPNRIIIIIII